MPNTFPSKIHTHEVTSTTQEPKFHEVDAWVPSVCSLPPAQYCETSRHTLLHPGSKCKCPAARLASDWGKHEGLGNAAWNANMCNKQNITWNTWNMGVTWCALPKRAALLVYLVMLQNSANFPMAASPWPDAPKAHEVLAPKRVAIIWIRNLQKWCSKNGAEKSWVPGILHLN